MRKLTEILEGTGYKKEEDIALFLAHCYSDYLYFAKHILGFEIADYHREWYDLAEKFNRLCVEAFRGSGKTCFFAGYFIWKAIFREGLNFLIVSNTFEQSKIVLRVIRRMIVDNEILSTFIPEGREYTWKATELTLKNGSIFFCKTYSEGIKGLRIDYCFCDEAGQYEDKAIFWIVISPVVQLNRGRIIVAGTPESHVDLLSELYENELYFSKKYPIILGNKPLWTQKYHMGWEDTDKKSIPLIRKEMGEMNFQQEYLLVPISASNSIFPQSIVIPCINNNEEFEQYGNSENRYYVGCDFSLSKDGDYTVYTVISSNNDGKKVVFGERFRGDFETQQKRLLEIFNRFRPTKLLLDKTGLGEQIFRDMAEKVPNVEPLHFTYDEKFRLIMDLRHEFEVGKISLPNSKSDMEAYTFTQNLLKELGDFVLKVDLQNRTKTKTKFGSGKYDDAVISLALALRASQSNYGSVSFRLV